MGIYVDTPYTCFPSIFIQNMVEAKLANYAYGIDKRKRWNVKHVA